MHCGCAFFAPTKGGCRHSRIPDEATPFARIDLSGVEPSQQAAAVAERAAQAQASLDLARGPLLRAVLFDFGSARKCQSY